MIIECEIRAGATETWFKDNCYHRDDGPAIIDEDGYMAWIVNGATHRDDGPAIIWADGTKKWYNQGKFIRVEYPE